MAYDPEVANSSGFFKDPVTKEDLSVDMPRAIECRLDNGKFIWPQVMFSNGNLGKIVYKYFTEEEKSLYKQYRGYDSKPSTPRKPKEPKPVTDKPKKEKDDGTYNSYKVEQSDAVSAETAMLAANCDRCIGVSQIGGVTYALLVQSGSSKIVHHVPRACISDSEWERLNGADSY